MLSQTQIGVAHVALRNAKWTTPLFSRCIRSDYLQVMLGLSLASSRQALRCFSRLAASAGVSFGVASSELGAAAESLSLWAADLIVGVDFAAVA